MIVQEPISKNDRKHLNKRLSSIGPILIVARLNEPDSTKGASMLSELSPPTLGTNQDERLPRLVDDVCIETADISFHLNALASRMKTQAKLFEDLRPVSRSLADQNERITVALAATQQSISAASGDISISRGQISQAVRDIDGLVDNVASIGRKLDRVDSALLNLSKATELIGKIARQTKMLALNAAIEAQRAGVAGAGFAIVAAEVKDLANQSFAATQQISSSLEKLRHETCELIEQGTASRRTAVGVSEGTRRISGAVDSFESQIVRILDGGNAILDASSGIGGNCVTLGTGMDGLGSEVTHLSADLSAAMGRLAELLTLSENLIAVTAPMLAEGLDARLIKVAIRLAGLFSGIFTQGISEGSISASAMFDEDYQPIPGTNPQQVLTKFVHFTDRVLPEHIEPVLTIDPKVVSCAAADRNGYVPTHNRKWSQPQSGDLNRDATYCRNRRIYNDRTATCAARNREQFLIQTYRRDIGSDEFSIMKSLSSPIMVGGRHWGSVRIIYEI